MLVADKWIRQIIPITYLKTAKVRNIDFVEEEQQYYDKNLTLTKRKTNMNIKRNNELRKFH